MTYYALPLMEKGLGMSQGDVSNPMDLVNGVCASAARDAGLKARLLADPRATLAQETGLTIPQDWELVASEAPDGTVQVGLVNEDIPELYLELVSGGGANCNCGEFLCNDCNPRSCGGPR